MKSERSIAIGHDAMRIFLALILLISGSKVFARNHDQNCNLIRFPLNVYFGPTHRKTIKSYATLTLGISSTPWKFRSSPLRQKLNPLTGIASFGREELFLEGRETAISLYWKLPIIWSSYFKPQYETVSVDFVDGNYHRFFDEFTSDLNHCSAVDTAEPGNNYFTNQSTLLNGL